MRSALEWAQVRALVADGVSERAIGVGWGSIGGRLPGWRGARCRPRYRRAPVASKLDPFEPVLRRLLEEWRQIRAPRATELLRDEYGYDGSIDLVKRLRELRPLPVLMALVSILIGWVICGLEPCSQGSGSYPGIFVIRVTPRNRGNGRNGSVPTTRSPGR